MTAAVIVSIRVDATPLRAFEAFTEEIGEWWRPNALFALTPRGDGHLRFEPAEGGRLVATLANGKEFEVGRVNMHFRRRSRPPSSSMQSSTGGSSKSPGLSRP